MAVESNQKQTAQFLARFLVAASSLLLLSRCWDLMKTGTVRPSGLAFPFGMMLVGLAGIIDPDRGQSYRLIGWTGSITTVVAVVAQFAGW